MKGLAARFPAPAEEAPETAAPTAPEPSSSAQPTPTQTPPPGQSHSPERGPERSGATIARNTTRHLAPAPAQRAYPPRPSPSRRPDAKEPAGTTPTAATSGVDPRFANGPLAVVDVVDGQVWAYCPGGLVLDIAAKSLPSLVEWSLTEARLGAPRLNRNGRDADPVLVLTDAAAVRFGLPARLTDEERRAGRLPEGHKVLNELERADWRLTRRGLGPWARIYRPAEGSRRACVQLCVLGWDALDTRSWGEAAQLPPADLAHLLGTYADRVMTPCGSTAVTGLELMTALHPPTRAGEPDSGGRRHSEHNPGSLGTQPVECAPPEAPDGHPLLAHLPRFHQRTPEEVLVEEAYDWARPLTDNECAKRFVVGLDVNMALAAAANGTVFGLGEPVHAKQPPFDPKTPGSWLVDLSHVELDPRLPSPFTPTGERPAGPAWYATPTVAYAVELGYGVAPSRRTSARTTGATWMPGTPGCGTPISPRWPTWGSPPAWDRRSS